MVRAQEPVERNKSSLLQAVVWLWTRQSLLTDKLCAMREDRSWAHVQGRSKVPPIDASCFCFIYLWGKSSKRTKRKESSACFQMDDQSSLVKKVIETPMRVIRQSHWSGGSGGAATALWPGITRNHGWFCVVDPGALQRTNSVNQKYWGMM